MEQYKTEADKVQLIYENIIFDTYDCIHCAIQDRQSVLDELKAYDEMIGKPSHVRYRIIDLTYQIEYLKSKL